MFQSMSRTAAVAVVALTLVLASVPAQASPFGPSLDTRTGWFDVAVSWLSSLVFGEEAPQVSVYVAAAPKDGGGTIQAGGCIDPSGRPRPCPEF
jgi:hypothetical protein